MKYIHTWGSLAMCGTMEVMRCAECIKYVSYLRRGEGAICNAHDLHDTSYTYTTGTNGYNKYRLWSHQGNGYVLSVA